MSIRTIMVVDDSPTDRHYLTEILEAQGFQVIAVESAEQAHARIRETRPDLVLMDIVMPGLNGFQATRQLTRDPVTAAIPVIILTSKNQEADRVWGSRQGAKGYITKPVDENLLLSSIRQVLGGSGTA